MRTVPGLRSVRMPSGETSARLASLTDQTTLGDVTAVPDLSTTFAVRCTTSPSNTLSATGTIVTVTSLPRGFGALASLHAVVSSATASIDRLAREAARARRELVKMFYPSSQKVVGIVAFSSNALNSVMRTIVIGVESIPGLRVGLPRQPSPGQAYCT